MELLESVPGAQVLPQDGEQLSSLQVKVGSTGGAMASDMRDREQGSWFFPISSMYPQSAAFLGKTQIKVEEKNREMEGGEWVLKRDQLFSPSLLSQLNQSGGIPSTSCPPFCL